MTSEKVRPLPHLNPGEVSLLDLATDDPRDNVALSDKEASILQLYRQIQEQQLEKALLEQDTDLLSGDNAEEQLAVAERELLEARATYTVRRKAVGTVLMTDPILKAVHLKASTPAEHATLQRLSSLEVENSQIHRQNQELVRELLALTEDDESWREDLEDTELKAQLDQVDADRRKSKAKWETMKNIASGMVVGSGVNWAEDERLTALVLDESDD
ncbi:hypothetical protein AbraIFM66951_009498 [Aspergillus brasiliensis]|uniref:Centromere protein H C-terminal domain-containing protein n=1 Tax=Aspergillus brasiliensis TaxID=319629 RepID=A0A9W5YN85_9EURO|nr:hypothetical protein AbraCBS73388_002290 [Aspergillus brasiliensis]GKZ41389.1 hypothetical protein AbraIFM66951_009498 [Aspergillus brasiliensis]